jgi:hypothetical protein
VRVLELGRCTGFFAPARHWLCPASLFEETVNVRYLVSQEYLGSILVGVLAAVAELIVVVSCHECNVRRIDCSINFSMILLATARPVSIIEITPEERLDLQARVKAHRGPQRHSPRATTILKRVVRMTQVDFAHDSGVSVACVLSEATRPVKPKTRRSVRSMAGQPSLYEIIRIPRQELRLQV